MTTVSPQKIAGERLKRLIKENYSSQEEFAFEYGTDVRTVSRYVNNGINKLNTIQELAYFFGVEYVVFFKPVE